MSDDHPFPGAGPHEPGADSEPDPNLTRKAPPEDDGLTRPAPPTDDGLTRPAPPAADDGLTRPAPGQTPTMGQAQYQPPTQPVPPPGQPPTWQQGAPPQAPAGHGPGHQAPPPQQPAPDQFGFSQASTQPSYQQPAHPGEPQTPYAQPGYQQAPSQPGGQPRAPYAQPGHQQPGTYAQPQATYPQPGYEQAPYQPYAQPQTPYAPPGYQQAPSQPGYPSPPGGAGTDYYAAAGQSFGAEHLSPVAGPVHTSGGIRRGRGRIAIVAAVVVIGALGTFALWRALSGPSGAETPEEAAATLFGSVDDEDYLGVAEIMLPSEREAFVQPSTAILLELTRLDQVAADAVDGDGNLQGFFGLQFDIPADGEPGALVYETQPIAGQDDLQWVIVTDGQIRVTFDPQELQDTFAGRLAEWIGAEIDREGLTVQTETVDLAEEYRNGSPLEFAVVREDGGYYVSHLYTAAMLATDKMTPPLDLAPIPVGADSPEQAAVDLVDHLVDLDAEGVLTLLDPQEFRVAYDYWAHYSPEMVQALDEARSSAAEEGVTWDLVSAAASSEERNGRRVVTYDEIVLSFISTSPELTFDLTFSINSNGLVMTGTVQGSPAQLAINGDMISGSAVLDGQPFEGELDLRTYEGRFNLNGEETVLVREGDCLLVISGGQQELVCDEELGFDGGNALLDLQRDYREALADAGRPGLTVVERDGRWYVSGFPTFAYTVVDFLSALDQEEFDHLLDGYDELIESGIDSLD